jgi:hypothetical protein
MATLGAGHATARCHGRTGRWDHEDGGLLIASALALATLEPALADRPPTPEERARIEAVLRDAGFRTRKEIGFDDGRWEVDDAVAADGVEYDLKLDPDTLSILERRRD